MKKIISLILCFAMCFSLVSCGGNTTLSTKAVSLSEGYKTNITEYNYFDKNFTISQDKFSLEVFANINNKHSDENIIISPISIASVLGMLLSGADGATLSEIEGLLQSESEEFNHGIYTFFDSLDASSAINNINSLWIKDDASFKVNDLFLQTNANFYGAEVFKSPFDKTAVENINSWVKDATDGEIKEIIGEIDKNTCMYLINALTFDAEWHTPYAKEDISDGTFNTPNASVPVKMMSSTENYYIETANAEGFIKEYKNCDYRFVALLPDKNTNVNDYISSLKNGSLNSIIKNANEQSVIATMPKFESTFEIGLNETLKDLGVKTAFNEAQADFSRLGIYQGRNLYLADVLQKAYIVADEKGTKAGAVTKAEIAAKTSLESRPVSVTLDRPFVYAIVDAKTNIPLFIGKVINP